MTIHELVIAAAIAVLLPVACTVSINDKHEKWESKIDEALATADEWRGRCAQTKVGAVGLFYAAFPGKRIDLIFPSGARETYYVSDIKRVECPDIASL